MLIVLDLVRSRATKLAAVEIHPPDVCCLRLSTRLITRITPPPQKKEERNRCVYINIYVYMSIYIIYIYKQNKVSSDELLLLLYLGRKKKSSTTLV